MDLVARKISYDVFSGEDEFRFLFDAIRKSRATGELRINFNQGGMSRQMQWTQKAGAPELCLDTANGVCSNPLEGASPHS